MLVPVSEWRVWRWRTISRWNDPSDSDHGIKSQYLPVFYLPLLGRDWAWRFHVWALRKYGSLFSECDLVLATWLYPDATAAAMMAREYSKPCWVKVHGSDRFHLEHPIRQHVILDAVRDVAGFLPNAEFLANYLVSHGIAHERIHVVRHGVDHTCFHRRHRDEAWAELLSTLTPQNRRGFGKDGPGVVLYVGNLVPVKGPDILLQAFAALHDACRRLGVPPCTMVMIGDGPLRKQLEYLALTLGVTDYVSFAGSRPPHEVALWMNVADCLCLPSRSEGMPNVVLESLACGCPVVAADVGDVSRSVGGETGIVVSDDSVSGLADGLSEALERRWNGERIAATVRDLTWRESAMKLVRCLEGSAE